MSHFSFEVLKKDKVSLTFWISGVMIIGYCFSTAIVAVVSNEYYEGFHVLKYIFVTLAPTASLFFSLRLAHSRLPDMKLFTVPLLLVTSVDLLLFLTNPSHHLMYEYVGGVGYYGAAFTWGTLFPLHIVVCYFVSGYAALNFLRFTFRHGQIGTRVASAAMILPYIYNILFSFFPRIFRMDLTTVLYAIAFAVFAFALYKDSLLGMDDRERERYLGLIIDNYPKNSDFIVLDNAKRIRINTNHVSEFSIGRKFTKEACRGLDYFEFLEEVLGKSTRDFLEPAIDEIYEADPGTSYTRTYQLDEPPCTLSTQLVRFGKTRELSDGVIIIHTDISETYQSMMKAQRLAQKLSSRERYLSLLQQYTPKGTTIMLCDEDRTVCFATDNIINFAVRFKGVTYDDVIGTDCIEGFKRFVSPKGSDIIVNLFTECDKVSIGTVVNTVSLFPLLEKFYSVSCVRYAPENGVHGGYILVLNDVTDLNNAKTAAEAASVSKSAFLSNISHEIRTPMNAIIGMTTLSLREELSDKVRLYLKNTADASNRLLSLINDVLDISKIESGKMDIVITKFDFSKMLDNSLNVISSTAREKNITIETLHPYDFERYMKSDELRISQIVVNLLSNAVKFTPVGGNITVDAFIDEDGNLNISVSDTGIGIAPENIDRLFVSFEQEDQSITRRYGGTGLGLAISKKIAELLGGTLTVQSEVNNGSTFTLCVPVKFGDEIGSPGKKGEAATYDFTGKRILMAEDVEINRLIVTALLENTGIEVIEAENGKVAAQLARKYEFDVILMDVQMPVMDGLTATREIRKQHKTTPIIAMTANAFTDDVKKCLEAGMTAHIAKPIDADKFMIMLDNYLNS
jgi:signal transduction histidine kinase/CheY-like chemotaxis protein